jgi:hypothetical protein
MKNIVNNPNAKPRPKEQAETVQYHHGRGAQINTKNKFLINEVSKNMLKPLMIGKKKCYRPSTWNRK